MAHSKLQVQPETAQVWFQTELWGLSAPQLTVAIKVWQCFHWVLDVLRSRGFCLHLTLTSITRLIPSPGKSVRAWTLRRVHCTLLSRRVFQRPPWLCLGDPVCIQVRRSGEVAKALVNNTPFLNKYSFSLKWSGMLPAGQMGKRSFWPSEIFLTDFKSADYWLVSTMGR